MTHLDATDLIRLNTEIEHNLTLDGDLVPLPGKDPLLLLANRHQDGYVFYYRRQVPAALREQIDAMGPQRAFDDDSAVQAILAGYAPYTRLVEGVGGYFAEAPTPDEFPGVIQEGDSYQIEIDGQAVSRAWSWFESGEAAELVVEALPDFRRHGYARQVAAAWAAGVMRAGRVAFYSYLADNEASAALARSLGVVEYATWVAYLRCRSPHVPHSRVAHRVVQN
jgi:RimJ/RimL family protein N-acetyltransferase